MGFLKELSLLLLLSLLPGPEAAQLQTGIVGGRNSKEGQWPWMAALFVKDKRGVYEFNCGGSLIHPQWVLTAAHCVSKHKVSSLKVYPGMYQRDVRKAPREVTRVVIHDSYVNELRFDLALLQLRQRVRRSKHIRPVKLSRTPFPPGTECWVTGWGRTGPKVSLRSPGILQELKVTLLDQESCKQMYPRDSIEPGNLCAWGKKKGKGTCQGDSGSPLVCQTSDSWEQAGIVNWADGCAQKATVYANVTHYIDWITKHVGGLD